MQFHLNGFRTGDPAVHEPSDSRVAAPGTLPPTADVLIVGCGPAGLTLAAQLAAFPDIDTLIVDQKPGPLTLGQADGVACRTMEMFQAFGFAERVLKEAYWVNETSFWAPDATRPGRIVRSGRVQDVEDGLSEFPHVILNQARVHDFYLDVMRNSPGRLEPCYSRRLVALDLSGDGGEYPVSATFERLDAPGEGRVENVRARYAVGCDGARSAVRKALGLELKGDAANQAWGVMDVLAVTDFPDVRLKSVIRSAEEGSIILIPREGGHLVRIYVELDKLAGDERVADRSITLDRLIAAVGKIIFPYRIDVKEVAWWSVYEIGQRLCGRFDDAPAAEGSRRTPRVFIAGDACHTHSPKAGQGMNVSMQDSFNLGWKLMSVLRGRAGAGLLRTYSSERQAIARELIDFDREWAGMLSASRGSGGGTEAAGTEVDPARLQAFFVRHGRYTAGTATRYRASMITGEAVWQRLAEGFRIGERFHSAPVTRLADARPAQLGHALEADGRWRLFLFGGRDAPEPGTGIWDLCAFLESSASSPLTRHTPAGADIDSVIDVRSVFQQSHRDLALERMPPLLQPLKGRYGLRDYEKMFCPDARGGGDIFDLRAIDRDRGCIVVVRPDQYVGHVLPLDARSQLAAFFDGFMLPADPGR